jgi:hypothetical protein
MKKIYLIIILILSITVQAQKSAFKEYDKHNRIQQQDRIFLSKLPSLHLPPDYYENKDVFPVTVDNSEQSCWRPVFAQVDYECGQASGIGLAYTYEINRLRGLPSNVSANQYPPHYAWNWGNGGEGWYGVSYFHSFEMLKFGGVPNVSTYGGMYIGDEEYRVKHWMTGYDNYYQAMQNRINEVYKIDLSTAEGIATLKAWIYDHTNGSEIGGVANFYANAPWDLKVLPVGTPEAGKHLIIEWGGANHGMTICAYHDSICWDYNEDGQYTNDIDINGDGEVDVKDWEIGGFKFANTYSGGPGFGDNGFCYMTYKSCADPPENGGIWDNAVHVLFAKEQMQPLLTAKIKLTGNNRGSVRVRMGYSLDENPEFVMQFPIFNFQGGNNYFQGGTEEEDKTIELGLDITPFLNMIPSGTNANFFLLVDENDPNGNNNGLVNNFSIIDYTDGINEISCTQTNVPMVNNGTLILSINHTVNYNNTLNIVTDEMDNGTIYQAYEFQIDADGGVPPYYFDFDKNYELTEQAEEFPSIDEENITPGNPNNGFVYHTLGFDFPFYGKTFDEVRVSVDGFLYFEDLFSWPYSIYDFFNFSKNTIIAPFMSDLYLNENDGIWYQGNDTSAFFRWKASIESSGTSDLNFAIGLFQSGRINLYYGNNTYPPVEWISGVSSGDNVFYQLTDVNSSPALPTNIMFTFDNQNINDFLQISPDGIVSGTPLVPYENIPVKIRVRDANNFYFNKLLSFSTDESAYVLIQEYSAVNTNGSSTLQCGDTVSISINLKNIGTLSVEGLNMTISENDQYLVLIDSTASLGSFAVGETKIFENEFTFVIGETTPNNYPVHLQTEISDGISVEWNDEMIFTGYAPVIIGTALSVEDGENGHLDPGETTNIVLHVKNTGGVALDDISVECSSSDPFITINEGTALINTLSPNETTTVTFNITVDEDAPLGSLSSYNFTFVADPSYENNTTLGLLIGFVFEGFETGNFSSLPWTSDGDALWTVKNGGGYEGDYFAESGDISDSQESNLELHTCFISEGQIAFAHRVSSEQNYDFLSFSLDGIEKASWSGKTSWELYSCPVSAGVHTLKWSYTKDYSISHGTDNAAIDSITFPPIGDINPQMAFDPGLIQDSLLPDILHNDTILVQNTGNFPLFFDIECVDEQNNPIDWLVTNQNTGSLNAGDSQQIILTINTSGMNNGDYQAIVRFTDHTAQTHDIPISLNVDILNAIQKPETARIKIFPNPFTNSINIGIELKQSSNVQYRIFDVQGKLLKYENLGRLSGGSHTISWNGQIHNVDVRKGIYYISISTKDTYEVLKIIKM